MKMFILGFVVAWLVLAGVAQFSESTGKGGVCLFGGWASTVLTIPLLPFALVWRGLYEIHKWLKKIFNRSAS